MKLSFAKLPISFCAAFAALLSAPVGGSPVPGETLHYNINWPTGVTLGEAQLSASDSQPSGDAAPTLHLAFDLDASIPGFSASDHYRSETSEDFCSVEFQRSSTHGSKRVEDKTIFDAQEGTATRVSAGGGKSRMEASRCSHDALAFLYFVRHELSQGRVPPPQTIFFGVPYDVSLDSDGAQNISIRGKQQEADHFTAHVQGPASNTTVEMFFLKDPARTLAMVRVPFMLGTFSMELVK
ncbi:MAG TPA: DUF3108 domain-containing protein [Bryobacteraceae bacterium]|nr:DUF3108 domain-containing protein [Bryobacteraceae bacterium]